MSDWECFLLFEVQEKAIRFIPISFLPLFAILLCGLSIYPDNNPDNHSNGEQNAYN